MSLSNGTGCQSITSSFKDFLKFTTREGGEQGAAKRGSATAVSRRRRQKRCLQSGEAWRRSRRHLPSRAAQAQEISVKDFSMSGAKLL